MVRMDADFKIYVYVSILFLVFDEVKLTVPHARSTNDDPTTGGGIQ